MGKRKSEPDSEDSIGETSEMSWLKKEEEEKPEVPEGQVRVEFLDGAFKGRIRNLSRDQARALLNAGRVKVV